MLVRKPTNDLEFLRRVSAAWARGDRQVDIAEAEGLSGGSGSIQNKLWRLGFKFTRGGRLVTTLDGRDFEEMLAAGQIVADEPLAEAVA
jgi:hypothetical protein